ncbi:MAG: acetyl-CoA acetyltransferase [Chloroflexi bacterium RBG_13_46_14]|nr:MAG: acetyl-CoA acetyltransferase [Chloroflexi bacterium RBG_13_46_14]
MAVGNIKDKVAVIGMGCVKFGENWDKSASDMMIDAAYEAYEDAGIEPKDIEAAWFGSTQISLGEPLAYALKLDHKPITRVENLCATATDAFRNACFGVASGMYDVVMALGCEKLKDSGRGGLGGGGGGGGGDMLFIPSGGPHTAFAQMANRYMEEYGWTYDEFKPILAKIAVKNHYNGSLNPKAHFQQAITEEQAINAPMMSWPLGLYDCCGVSDGSAAAIITRADMAKSFRDDYTLVKGVGLAVGARQGWTRQDFDMVHMEPTVQAGRQAYEQAGIKDPFKEIDLAEVHDCFSITELVIMEDLGFSPRGQAPEYIKEGRFLLDGDLAVNPDGGLKSFGHPIGASGLRMLYEVYKQMQGKAGPRQRKNPTLGLTHNFGFNPGSGVGSVTIMGQADTKSFS